MCDPISMGLMVGGIGAASSVMGFIGQNKAAAANATAANLAYANTSNQLGEKGAQIDAQQSENTVQAMIDRLQGQGRISASASSFGADAATAASGANAVDFTAGRSLGIEDINSRSQRVGLQADYTNAWYARQSQKNQVLKQSPLQLALGLAKAGASGVGAFSQAGGQFPGGGGSGSVDTSAADAAFSSQMSAIGGR